MALSHAQTNPQVAPILHPLVERYLSRLRVEGGLATNTLEAYRHDLARFQRYLGRQHTAMETAPPKILIGFLASLKQERLSPASVARILSALRGWYRFLVREGLAADNPLRDLAPARKSRQLPKTLTLGEVTALLDLPAGATLEDERDRAMLELLYASGLRVSELIALEVSQIDFDLGCVRVRGKGSKERLVPMGQAAHTRGSAYLEQVRPALLQGDRKSTRLNSSHRT